MYQYIHEQRQIKPLLLLDDIFEKIDKSRMQQLVNIISETSMGQVVITDTSSQRVQDYFKDKFDVKIIEI
jgi:DNA replication and repair protein RecF